MIGRLAVFTPQLGTVSETFIRRHVEDLVPGRTVVVAHHSSSHDAWLGMTPYPVLFLDKWALRFPVRIGRNAGLSDRRLKDYAVRRFLWQQRVGAVLIEYLDQFLDFIPLLEQMNIPYVAQGHGIDVSAALRAPRQPQRYLAYSSARAVLTRGEMHRDRLVALGLPAHSVHVNPGGVDIPSAGLQRDARAAKRFLAVGRMTAKKGPICLLEAFRLAAAEDPTLSLDYVGSGTLSAAVRQFVDACGLRERVTLHGAAADDIKEKLFRECGIFVQHSLTDPETGDEEGLPASIQEAMAYGLAIVSTRHSGIAEAVEDGASGFLVPEGDIAGMAAAMLNLSRKPELAAQMGRTGRRKAEQAYSWTAERARLLRYLGIVEAPGKV